MIDSFAHEGPIGESEGEIFGREYLRGFVDGLNQPPENRRGRRKRELDERKFARKERKP